MKRIYKYPLSIEDVQTIQMPLGAEALAVGEQDGRLVLWAFIETDNKIVLHFIRIIGTGHPFPDSDNWLFVGTVQCKSGLVWHVFREKSPVA